MKSLDDNALRRIAQSTDDELDLHKIVFASDDELDLHKIVFASNDAGTYRVTPIYEGESLATLRRMGKDGEETGERTRVYIHELFDSFVLFDADENIISVPEDYVQYRVGED